MTGSIEFAQLNAKVIEGIEQGNAALDALNKACSIERVEEVSTSPHTHTHTHTARESETVQTHKLSRRDVLHNGASARENTDGQPVPHLLPCLGGALHQRFLESLARSTPLPLMMTCSVTDAAHYDSSL